MPKQWIDKKKATTFTLVHRPQNDPLIHDEQASSMIFKEVGSGNSSRKVKTTTDLEHELGENVTTSVRKNEGEASMYGIYYDDTKYDYMQHLRDIGASSDSIFVEAAKPKSKQPKQKLEDALREPTTTTSALLPADMLPSNTSLPKKSYQAQQNIPDALAGFQPDMDPRLREVLEALEDEEYVDDDEDLFGQLTKDGEADEDEFFEQGEFDEEEEDDGWNTDDTEKPAQRNTTTTTAATTSKAPAQPPQAQKAVKFDDPNEQFEDADEDEEEGEAPPAWLREYSKFKKAIKKNKTKMEEDDASSLGGTMSIGTSNTMSTSARTRKRNKKHGTTSSEYSMSSSSMTRTEGLTLLDDRFEKIEEEYAEDDSDEDSHIPLSQREGAFIETRTDFNSMLDDFLDNYSVKGSRVKKGKYQTGIEQLDEVRSQLGKARITPRDRRHYV
ncbi:low-temperature viability protein-like protein ltv1 [Peziza echinospora]|nr:low-temperature viability protein-like protein ltv1 [Peziza echinospora]